MRTNEVYVKCKNCYEKVCEEINFLNENNRLKLVTATPTRMLLETSLSNILKICQELIGIGGIEIIIKRIEGFYFNKEENKDKVLNTLNDLRISIWAIIEMFQSIGIKQNDVGLNIKMPKTDNITEFKKYVDDLEFIFTKCPFFKDDNESLRFEGVDIGSVWLVLAIRGITVTTGSVLIYNIAAFIDKCYVIKSHKLTCEQQKIELEKAKIELKQKEDMLKTIDQMYQISVSNAISDLENITKIEIEDNDERDRAIQSFDRLDKLIDKGLQIYASIDSPQEVKAVFAPIEMHYLPQKENVTKIEEKTDEQ